MSDNVWLELFLIALTAHKLNIIKGKFVVRKTRRELEIICRELLGLEQKHDQPTPSKRTKEYYAERPCADFCATAAAIFEEHYRQELSR